MPWTAPVPLSARCLTDPVDVPPVIRSRRRPGGPSDGGPVEIPGYDVLDRIGAGGFSVVYRARQRSMSRDVAVKVLNTGFASDAERRTFERECHALGRLSHHPNIVTVFNDAFTTDGRPCIVMELYHTTFRQLLDERSPLPIADVLAVGVRMCGALQTAHDAGVLHRDLKPHNIFVSAYGDAALGDFGISTIDDERSHTGASGLSVAYAAPEVLEEGHASASADVYALGATLYQLASGASPFASPDLKSTVRRILTEEPAPIGRDDAPGGFDRALRQALAKRPDRRPASAVEFAEMLREVQARAGFERTPIPRWSAPASAAAPAPVVDDRPPPPISAPETPAARAVEVPVPGPGAADGGRDGTDDVSGVTIARPRSVVEPVEDEPPAGSFGLRRWLAPVAALAAIGVVVVGISLAGGNDDGGQAGGGPVTSAPPPETFFQLVPAPAGVSVTEVGDGRFEVGFEVPDDVTAVEIEVVGGAASGRPIVVEASPGVVAVDGAVACVVLRSLGERGRVSADVGPVCSS